jgi:hypothetical protein
VKEIFALGQLAEPEIEKPGSVTIEEHNAQAGKCYQQLSERFQMKMTIHRELRAAELRGEIVLAPKALRGAGEHTFGARSVAAKFLREAHDAVEIGAGGFVLLFIDMNMSAAIASMFQLAQDFSCQVFCEDGFFLVGFVAGRCVLKVKT